MQMQVTKKIAINLEYTYTFTQAPFAVPSNPPRKNLQWHIEKIFICPHVCFGIVFLIMCK
jgi:hypothetical protein